MKKTVGVDIGSTAVRVVEVSELNSDGFAIISRFGIAALKEGAVVAGKIKNPQLVSMALERAFKDAGVRKSGFIIGLGSPEVAVGRVNQPAAVKRSERVAALRGTGKEISPTVPLGESAVSTNLLRTDTDTNGAETNVLIVAAALRSEVENLLATCKLVGATPRAIDIAGAGTMRALVRTVADAREVATVVDVGATKTTIITREGPHMRSIRSAAAGGIDITRAILGVSDDTLEQAEERKLRMRLGEVHEAAPVLLESAYGMEEDEPGLDELGPQTSVEEAMSNVAEDLIDQIAQSIELDAANHGSMSQGIFLCGGTALLRGFKERLERRVGVTVKIGKPWAQLERSKRNASHINNGVEDPYLMHQLVTATGLALWKSEA